MSDTPKPVVGWSDALIATIAVFVVGFLLVPLPAFALDLAFIGLILFAFVTLFIAMTIEQPLDFSAFPPLLLLSIVGRISLVVAATRAILVTGEGGRLIAALGDLLLGGNAAVGLTVFLILVFAQFLVVTGGTQRVSEVTARFTLDALPGKQMAIDADLNAGIITEVEAKKRRKGVEREADFYGSMDGASKYVRGEAIAAIVILLLCIAGGMVVGVFQKGLNLSTAFNRYSSLTVGMGIAAQVSSLLTSLAAGILVTRSTSETHLGDTFSKQLLARSAPLFVSAGMVSLVLLLPGAPRLPLFAIALVVGGLGYWAFNEERKPDPSEAQQEPKPPTVQEELPDLLRTETLEIEVGYGLVALLRDKEGGLLERTDSVRRLIAKDLGLIVPPIHLKDNLTLGSNDYVIRIHEAEVARGNLQPHSLLAINPGSARAGLDGQAVTEPVFGMPALWIRPDQRTDAERAGYTVVEPASTLVTHLTETIKKNSATLLDRQQTQTLLDAAKKTHPAVVEELIPNILSLGEIHRVLQNLLTERVPIRTLVPILEALADQARVNKDAWNLTEAARRAIGRNLCRMHRGSDTRLPVLTLSPRLEAKFAEALHKTDTGPVIALPSPDLKMVVEQLSRSIAKHMKTDQNPLLLCPGAIRAPVRRVLERILPNLTVMAYEEVDAETHINILDSIDEPVAQNV